jgi:hypothetical protein
VHNIRESRPASQLPAAMPRPLNSNSVGILQEASDAGKRSRTPGTLEPESGSTVNKPLHSASAERPPSMRPARPIQISTLASRRFDRRSRPDLPAQERGAEQDRQHRRAHRSSDTEIAAKDDHEALQHRHGNATQYGGAARRRKHGMGRPAEDTRFAYIVSSVMCRRPCWRRPRSNAERGLPRAEVRLPRWNILNSKTSGPHSI